jgi:predicted phosphodiesterase
MKLLVLSDLHLEHGASLTLPPSLEYDVVVLAGDIHSPGHKAVHWAQRDSTFGGRPVVLVPGNHEFYDRELRTELAAMRQAAEGSNVHVLSRASVVIHGVRFLGCMLWTDFQLPIHQPDGSTAADVGRALEVANRGLNDFRLITVAAPTKRQYREREFRRLLRAEDTLSMHWVDRDWLRRQLDERFAGPTVVVTHHAPSSGSAAERYASDWLTAAFVSDLPDPFFVGSADVWIHGHTHTSFDYVRGACRVLSNPRGYRLSDGSFENDRFSAQLLVDIGRKGRLSDADFEPTDCELRDVAAGAWKAARAACADMVGDDEAALLAGVPADVLRAWATSRQPKVIALVHPMLGRRFPRWQFDSKVWTVVQRLSAALQGNSWAMLSWLETPLGAFDGRTPQAACEQGEPAERVLAVANHHVP